MGYTTEVGEYKGYPTISIFQDSNIKFPVISFGTNKAKAILATIAEVAAFVQANSKGGEQ